MKNPIKAIMVAVLVCTIASICFVYTASAQSTQVKAEVSTIQPHVGDTLTINIKISNAQNLYGVDVTLDWNPSTLALVSATHQLGVESYSGGVLHESSSYPIDVIDNDASQSDGKYHLLATSTGSTTPAFTGSGTIAVVTFTVTGTGASGLALNDVELSQLASDGTINLVNPSTSVDSVTPVGSFVSATPTTSVTPTTSATPEASVTPTVPELSTSTILALLIVLATAAMALSMKRLKARESFSAKTASKF
jgi:minor extracellular serine protease Vpr